VPANTLASGPAGRYATALFELASQRHALEQVETDLGSLGQAIDESPDLARMITSPVVSRDGQGKAMEALAGKLGLGQIVQNFLGVLAKQRRLGALPAVIADFRRQLAAHRGEEVRVRSGDAAVDDVARDDDGEPVEPALGAPDGEGVEQGLGRVLVGAVAGVDDGRPGARGDVVRRS